MVILYISLWCNLSDEHKQEPFFYVPSRDLYVEKLIFELWFGNLSHVGCQMKN